MPVKSFFDQFRLGSAKRFATLVVVAALVAGCGDDGGDASPASSAGSGGGSGSVATFSISGTPPSQVMVGVLFSFTPTISNPGGIALSFSASNLPGWAAINGSTGQVTGTPSAADVGTYSNIRVTVSGGGQSVTSPAYSVTVVSAASGSAQLSWLPPTQRTDGSALTNLAGYRIYYGQSQNNLNQSVTVNSAGITSYVVDQLTPATWFFAAAAIDSNGVESALSNVASKTIM